MPRDDPGSRAERETIRRVQGSGAWIGAKGDFRSADFLIEQKSTSRGSLGVKLDWLRKICREAMTVGLRPAFHLVFVDLRGKPVRNGAWVMVRESDWTEMTTDATDQPEE